MNNKNSLQLLLERLRQWLTYPGLREPVQAAPSSTDRSLGHSSNNQTATNEWNTGNPIEQRLRAIAADGRRFRSSGVDPVEAQATAVDLTAGAANGTEVRSVASEWLGKVTAACTPESLRNGDLRLRPDDRHGATVDFARLTTQLSPQLRKTLVDVASQAFNDNGDADYQRLSEVVDQALEAEERMLSSDQSSELQAEMSVQSKAMAMSSSGESFEPASNEATAELPDGSRSSASNDTTAELSDESLMPEPDQISAELSEEEVVWMRSAGGVGSVSDPESQMSTAEEMEALPPLPPLSDWPDDDSEAPTDPMSIHRHVLPNLHTQAMRKPAGANAIGSEPRNWERYADDGAIFTGKRPGGVLLIDCSGSMSWDFKALQKAIRQMPAAKVAIYSGADERGRLCVIADKGRWGGFDEQDVYGGNEIDIEALEWLASHTKGPKIWLSDGQIVGGQVWRLGLERASDKVEAICRSGKIHRAETMDAALMAMRYPNRSNVPGLHRADRGDIVPGRGLDRGFDFY